MGKITEFIQDHELDKAVDAVMKDSPHLIKIKDKVKILSCFIQKCNDDEEGAPVKGMNEPVVLKKVAPAMQVFIKSNAQFVLIADRYWWDGATESLKKGKIARALFCIKVDTGDSGEVKIGTKKWDIQENFHTIETYGAYDENSAHMSELLNKQRNMQLTMTESALSPMPKTKSNVKANGVPKSGKPAAAAKAVDEDDADNDEPEAEQKPRVVAARSVMQKARPVVAATTAVKSDTEKEEEEEEEEEVQPERVRSARRLTPELANTPAEDAEPGDDAPPEIE